MNEIEVIVTGHSAWWLRLINWLGAGMKWTHALLLFHPGQPEQGYVIEAIGQGVVKRPWRPESFESYARFSLKPHAFGSEHARKLAVARMQSFALGEVGKRYKYEALGAIGIRILRRMREAPLGAYFIGVGEVCTSLVDRTFKHVRLDLVPNEPSPYVLPDEIAASHLLQPVAS